MGSEYLKDIPHVHYYDVLSEEEKIRVDFEAKIHQMHGDPFFKPIALVDSNIIWLYPGTKSWDFPPQSTPKPKSEDDYLFRGFAINRLQNVLLTGLDYYNNPPTFDADTSLSEAWRQPRGRENPAVLMLNKNQLPAKKLPEEWKWEATGCLRPNLEAILLGGDKSWAKQQILSACYGQDFDLKWIDYP